MPEHRVERTPALSPPKHHRHVIHEVDEALAAVIEMQVLNGTEVEVVFDAPNKDWAARRTAPTVDVFLYDIREDLTRRDTAVQTIRNDDGRAIMRRPPPRRFKLSYLITAWTQRPEDEHRLLSTMISGFLRFDRIPDEHLGGSLVDAGVPVLTALAMPATEDRSLSDIWTALGGELKPSLDLTVIAPIDPSRDSEVGPPVLEGARLEGGRGPLAMPDPDAEHEPAEILRGGTDERPGRTFKVGAVPRGRRIRD